MKNYTGITFGKLTAIKFVARRGKHTYWLFSCECGREIERIPTHLKLNKFNSCRQCMTGENTMGWKGCNRLPGEILTIHKHSAKNRGFEFSVTAEYLWSLYEKQRGKCVFTGFPIGFNKTSQTLTSRTASLDRIDSSKGYIEGNLQWVHRDVNKLKKNFSDERFLELCLAIAKHNSILNP